MVKRTSLMGADCPVARALDVIGDWWSLLIIRDVLDGLRRFTEIQSNLGIAKGMLATRLRDLVMRGVLQTAPASDGTAYREYTLTENGRRLFLVIVALRQWGEDHLYAPSERHSVLIEAATGERVGRLEMRSADGRVLDWSETKVRQPQAERVVDYSATCIRTSKTSQAARTPSLSRSNNPASSNASTSPCTRR